MRWSDDIGRGWTVSPGLAWNEVTSTTYRLLLGITANAAAAATLGRDRGDAGPGRGGSGHGKEEEEAQEAQAGK